MKKIFRWLLNHLLLILVVVSVIYGYMFWGNLTGEGTPVGKTVAYLSNKFDGVDQFVEGVKNKQARLAGLQDGQQQAGEQLVKKLVKQGLADTDTATANVEREYPKKNVATEDAIDDQTVTNDQENTLNGVNVVSNDAIKAANAASTIETIQRKFEQQPVSISYSHNNMRVQQNSDGKIEVQPQAQSLVAQTEDAATEKTPKNTQQNSTQFSAPEGSFIPAEIASQLDKVDENSGLVKEELVEENARFSPNKTSIHERWMAARISFYQKNYELSEQGYQSVIADTKDNFDAYGELGNVYFNQGKNAQAAEAYLQAAIILLAQGDLQRVQSLLQILQQLDMSKANQLQRLMGLPSS